MWFKRDIHDFLLRNQDIIQVLRGPRQCGKSSLILNLDSSFKEISLDDPAMRELAQSDPELFLSQYPDERLFIDEAQYAPALFPSLKRRADLYKREHKNKSQTILRLTGSNQILMDRNIKESLAGRASFFDLNTLSVAEILESKKISIQEILFKGGWPELHANPQKDTKKFLDDYINSYVEKDIVLSAGIQKSREFFKFIRLLAGRVGTILDLASLARDIGVDGKTLRDWVSILERMHLIALVEPYYSSRSTRLVKSPKLYFLDTGLACRLQGWTSIEPILNSPQQGPLFENLVFAEIFKANLNFQLGWQIFHWRSRDGEEVDFLLQLGPTDFLFIEVKVSPQKPPDLSHMPEVQKVFSGAIPDILLCHQEGTAAGSRVPIGSLASLLRQRAFT